MVFCIILIKYSCVKGVEKGMDYFKLLFLYVFIVIFWINNGYLKKMRKYILKNTIYNFKEYYII